MSSQAVDIGKAEEVGHGDRLLKQSGQPLMDLQQQQGMTAKIEEVVVQPYALQAQRLGPHLGDGPLQFRLWRNVSRAHDPRLVNVRRGSAFRLILPLGVRGMASRITKVDGTMYSGNR